MSKTSPRSGPPPAEAEPTVALPEPAVPRIANWAVIGIFLILLLGTLYLAASFLLPVVFALLFMLVLSPVVRVARRRLHMPEPLTASALVVTTALILVTAFYTLSGPLASVVEGAPRYVEAVDRQVSELRDRVFPPRLGVEEAPDADAAARRPQSVILDGPNLLGSAAMMVPQIAASLGFALIFLFFLMSSRTLFYHKLIEVLPSLSDKKKALSIAYEIETELSRYLFTITMINAGLGIVVGLEMWLLGLPTPYVFGALAFVLNFIPYLGAIIGIALVGLVSLAEFGSVSDALLPMMIYFATTSFEGQLVTPILVGRRLQMNAAAVFLSVAFWGWIWGVVGMFLAVPLMVGVKIFASHIEGLWPIANFLSTDRQAEGEDERR